MGRQRKATEAVEVEPVEVGPDELRAYDKRGNVRPADDRFLTPEQTEIKDEYVAVATADDTSISLPDPTPEVDPDATPLTSPRGDDDTTQENA